MRDRLLFLSCYGFLCFYFGSAARAVPADLPRVIAGESCPLIAKSR